MEAETLGRREDFAIAVAQGQRPQASRKRKILRRSSETLDFGMSSVLLAAFLEIAFSRMEKASPVSAQSGPSLISIFQGTTLFASHHMWRELRLLVWAVTGTLSAMLRHVRPAMI